MLSTCTGCSIRLPRVAVAVVLTLNTPTLFRANSTVQDSCLSHKAQWPKIVTSSTRVCLGPRVSHTRLPSGKPRNNQRSGVAQHISTRELETSRHTKRYPALAFHAYPRLKRPAALSSQSCIIAPQYQPGLPSATPSYAQNFNCASSVLPLSSSCSLLVSAIGCSYRSVLVMCQ